MENLGFVEPSSEQKIRINEVDEATLKRIIEDALADREKRKLKKEFLMFSYTMLVTSYLGTIAILLSMNPSRPIDQVSIPALVAAIAIMAFCDFAIWGFPFIRKKKC